MPTKTKRNNSLYCRRYYSKNREKICKFHREKYREKSKRTQKSRIILYGILNEIVEEPLDLLI